MRAALLYGTGDLRVEEIDTPQPKENQVLVKIKAASLCPTDIRKYKGSAKFPEPVVLGHEGAGIVEAVGSEVTSFVEGDTVWPCSIQSSCGKCKYCMTGRMNLCDDLRTLGFAGGSIENGMKMQKQGTFGIFSEYTAVPESGLIKLPPGISLGDASMIEPLSCVLHSCEICRVSLGNMVVMGCGPMGLLHIGVAKTLGASKVIASDPIAERREKALELGADKTVDPKEVNPIDEVKELTDGYGADVVIVSVGGRAESPCVEDAVKMGAKGARINIFAGAYPKEEASITINPNLIHYRELVLTASFGFKNKHVNEAIELIQRKGANIGAIRKPVITLDEIKRGFEMYGKPEVLKVGIDF